MKFYVVNRIPIKRRVRFNRSGRTYTDAKTAQDMQLVRSSYSGPMYIGPVALIVFVYKQLPKARIKKQSEPFVTKPDLDNVLKAVMDGLKGVAYSDDNQVTITYIKKLDRKSIAGEYVKYAVIPAEKLTGVIVESEVVNEF